MSQHFLLSSKDIDFSFEFDIEFSFNSWHLVAKEINYKNEKEQQLIDIGCLPMDGNSYENSTKFPYLVIDENGEVNSLHKSAIPNSQYKKEIVFNKTKKKWEYVSNSSNEMQ